MKKTITSLAIVALLITSKIALGQQWTGPDANQGITNSNTGAINITGFLNQSTYNPPGNTLQPGTTFSNVNANFGGLLFHSTSNTASVMNMFWGQNFDYHNNDNIRYRISAPAAMQQFANGSMYFYTAPYGVAGTQIDSFKFKPKVSLVNNGGFAVGNTFAYLNNSSGGTLLVERFIGLGTITPSDQLHTTGGVRFQGLTAGGTPNNIVTIDANGRLWRSPLTGIGIQNLCTTTNFITKTGTGGNLSCSQLFDNGTTVGINQTSGFNYTGLTVVGSSTAPSTGTARLAVNGVTMSLAYFATSDERMKSDVQDIRGALEKIKKLRGKSYKWKADRFGSAGADHSRQLGFMAQDLAKTLPEVVVKKEDGTYAVNYNGIIPVLTEALKEQEASMDVLRNEIVNLKNEISNLKGRTNNNGKLAYFTVAPNPFSQDTKITYDLPATHSKVLCLVYDLQGRIIKQMDVPVTKGKGSLFLSGSGLSAGVYFVAFTVNNQEVQVEKVILTN